MSICLLVISDGRDGYRERSLASADVCLPPFADRIEVEDRDHRLGFAGAISEGWRRVLEAGHEWCFHLEADFVFNRPVPLGQMLRAMEANKHLVQMALLRGPENSAEASAGGVIEQHSNDYVQIHDGPHSWLEHRRFFTTNPSLIPGWVMRAGWPQGSESEGHFGLNLFASDPALRAAFWGTGERWVEHIGAVRAGVGY